MATSDSPTLGPRRLARARVPLLHISRLTRHRSHACISLYGHALDNCTSLYGHALDELTSSMVTPWTDFLYGHALDGRL